jgi:pSer/pThr/pTyr-binding forkhead associated (FHA) protein
MWLLTIEDDEGLTTFHHLTRDRYTIGRAPGSDFVLAQLDVSRRHARLERGEGGFQLFDEAGRGSTFLNAMPFEGRALLRDGDLVQIAGYRLRFSTTDEAADVPPPPRRSMIPARLRALAGPLAGDEILFARGETITIGSSEDCHLRVLSQRVSPVHALFVPLPGGRHEIVDKSHNGLLFVNGRPVPGRQVLEGGDTINVGHAASFGYLEPNQQPNSRFDAVWAEGAVALGLDPPPTSTSRLPAASASPASEAPVPREGDRARSDARIEVVGPRALPVQAPPSASFERLCRETIGRAEACVEGPADADEVESSFFAPPPSSSPGHSLVAFETPAGGISPTSHGHGGDVDERGAAGELEQAPDDAAPQIEIARERPRHAWLVVLLAAAAMVSGAMMGMRTPGRGSGRTSLTTTKAEAGLRAGDTTPAGAGASAPEQPAVVETSPAPSDASAVEVAPSKGEAALRAGEATPSAGEAAPRAGEAAPRAGEAAASKGEAAPSKGEAAPSKGEAAPSTGEAAPRAREAVPSTGEAAPPAGATGRAAPPAGAEATPPPGATGRAAPPAGATGRVAPPAAMAPAKESAGVPKGGGGSRRERLTVRARSGRASADELRELLSLCYGVGDSACVAEVRSFTARGRP